MPSFLGSLVNILNVPLSLAGHYGLIVAAAFLLLCWRLFRELIHSDTCLSEKVVMILFFGALGILGTCAGTPPSRRARHWKSPTRRSATCVRA